MNEAQADQQIKKAIEDSEVIVDEQTRTYQILVDTLGTRVPLNERDRAGDMLARQKRALGHKARLEHLGYTAKPANLGDLRSSLTDGQRIILNTIWRYYIDPKYEAAPWIRAGFLYHSLGEGFDERKVHDILNPLGGTAVYENPNLGSGVRYVLTALGILLTEQGEEVEIVLASYLEYVRQQFIKASGVAQRVVLKDIGQEFGLTSDQFYLLRRVLFWFSDFSGGGGSVDEHNPPLCLDKLVTVKDLRTYIREHEFSKFDPSVPVTRNPLLTYSASNVTNKNSSLTDPASAAIVATTKMKKEVIPNEAESQKSKDVKIFISYASKDKGTMQSVKTALETIGIKLWVDEDGIRGGDSFPQKISEGLQWCDIFLLIWSTNAKASKWVNKELDSAHALDKKIIPCIFDNTELPALLTSTRYIDFRAGFDKGLGSLIHSLDLSSEKENLATAREATDQRVGLDQSEELNRQRRPSIKPAFTARLDRKQIGSKHQLFLTNVGDVAAVNIQIAPMDLPAPPNKRDATPEDILSITARDIAAYNIQGERDAYIVFDFIEHIDSKQAMDVSYKPRFRDEDHGKGSPILREYGYGNLDFLSLLDDRHALQIDFHDTDGNKYHQVITKEGNKFVSGKVSLVYTE